MTHAQRVYPLAMTHVSIVVPEAEPFSGFYGYLLTLTTNELFAYSAGTVAATVLTLSACRYIKQKKLHFSQSLIDVLNLLIINDNGYINYPRLSCAETFVIIPLTFIGFIVVNGYLSSLKSYVTTPVLQPKLKTLGEIYNSPLKILTIPSYENFVLERLAHRTHQDWSNKIVAIDENFMYQMFRFNTSIFYTISNDDFNMISMAQRRLNIRGFYDTGVTVTCALNIFPVHESVLFFDKLSDIVHRTHSSGLLQQWMRNSVTRKQSTILAMNRKKIQRENDDKSEIPFFI